MQVGSTLIVALFLLGCGQSPAPVAAPRLTTPAAALTVSSAPPPASAAPAPRAAAPPAPPPVRLSWTTAENSNECSKNPGGDAYYYQHFETREGCETWVKERSCRPGFACFDGCNWRHCTGGGDGMTQTLLGCFSRAYNFEFSPSSMDPQKEPDGAWMQQGITQELKAPQRRVVISGYVESGDSDAREGAEKRALARAELVRRMLLKRGLPAKRLVTQLGDVENLRDRGYEGTLALVRVTFEPTERVREDFEPRSREYQQWCGTVPGK